jgi:uncharacterized protein YqgC (DUF456 family)
MWDWVIIAILLLVSLIGVILTAVRLPGTWLILIAAGVYGWTTEWQRVTVALLLILAGVAVVGELIELFASMVTAKKAGASRQAAWGALLGGFVGMFIFTIPVPIIGTIIGAILGCFCGALIGETMAQRKLSESTRVGYFSALGFVLGMAAKLAIALVMTVILTTSVVCSRAEDGGRGLAAEQAGLESVAPEMMEGTSETEPHAPSEKDEEPPSGSPVDDPGGG